MADELGISDSFTIERNFAKPVTRVFGALSDPAQKRRWYAESDNHTIERFEIDFRVGGAERTRYRMAEGTPIAGAVLENEGVHLDIVPERRIVIASTMALGGRRFSASLAIFETIAEAGGTRFVFTHQGMFFEGADGPKMRRAGWEGLIARFAAEVLR